VKVLDGRLKHEPVRIPDLRPSLDPPRERDRRCEAGAAVQRGPGHLADLGDCLAHNCGADGKLRREEEGCARNTGALDYLRDAQIARRHIGEQGGGALIDTRAGGSSTSPTLVQLLDDALLDQADALLASIRVELAELVVGAQRRSGALPAHRAPETGLATGGADCE
jgi:hypothetical protein